MRGKVLIIAHAYPPYNSMGALRAAKFAKYLPRYGWEPIVITRIWPEGIHGLEEPPGVRVIRTTYHDRLGIFRRNHAHKKGLEGGRTQSSPRWHSKLRRMASFWLKEILAYPDEFIGWKPYALEAARKILQEEDISVIFSTSPPPTSHLIATELQQETGLPWVADFRDLWTLNHYVRHTLPRRWVETRLEKKVMRNASMLITVSRPLAEKLQRLHRKPVEVITNGYDEEDYPDPPPPVTPYFSITYTGQIYAGKRDPSLLFAAVQRLLKKGLIEPQRFMIRFYGPEGDRKKVLELANHYGIKELVFHGGRISHAEAIYRQRESTVLLLLCWLSPEEKGVYTGKVFEYLGARRPILAIPRLGGVVDELLEDTQAGVSATTVEEIEQIIKAWYDEFIRTGEISCNRRDDIIKNYTREAQTQKLAKLFDRLS